MKCHKIHCGVLVGIFIIVRVFRRVVIGVPVIAGVIVAAAEYAAVAAGTTRTTLYNAEKENEYHDNKHDFKHQLNCLPYATLWLQFNFYLLSCFLFGFPFLFHTFHLVRFITTRKSRLFEQ